MITFHVFNVINTDYAEPLKVNLSPMTKVNETLVEIPFRFGSPFKVNFTICS
jgi:hypothetical protein